MWGGARGGWHDRAVDAAPPPDPARSVSRTARQRAREEITREILEAARVHLATDGAAGLSLRAVARDLGMASSALYRYFKNRDDLLTALIIEAYDALGAAAEAAEAPVDRADLGGRFAAVCAALRAWARAHANEYALIYGSPVPGYAAPADTVGPASRVSRLLLAVLVDAARAGAVAPAAGADRLGDAARAALAPLRAVVPAEVPDGVVLRGLMVWTALLGAVSSELFGQLHNVVTEAGADAVFAECVARWAALVGIGEAA